jgi:hypothetical protein
MRYTLKAPESGEASAMLWFARFDGRDPARTFGVHRKFPIAELRESVAPHRIRIGESELGKDHVTGKIAGDGHQAEWSFTFQPSEHLHLHLPDFVYRASFADTQVLSPNCNVAAHGHITVDGQRYALDGDPLGQTHLWGRKHAYSWAWSHCNAFKGDRGALLETLTVRLRKGSFVTPRLTLMRLGLDGDDPSELDFRSPVKWPFVRSDYATGRYYLRATSPTVKVEAEYTCRAEDMLMAEYEDPDGTPAYCHNTECASCLVTVWRKSPFSSRLRLHRTLTADKTAHYEWGARAGDPLVKKRHVLAP